MPPVHPLAAGPGTATPRRTAPYIPAEPRPGSPPSAQAHPDPHDGPVAIRSHLHEVAHLVGDVEAPAALRGGPRPPAADERVAQPAAVPDLAHERPVLLPHPQDPVAAAVADAVGGQLVDREDKVLGAGTAQA